MKARYRELSPLLDWKQTPDWGQVFPRPAPLVLEIGFGNGEYLVRNAQEHPEQNFVGVEITWGSLRRALGKTANLGLPNVRYLWGDARAILLRSFAERSLDYAYSLFPCPWPKKRHAKNRLFQASFLKLINSRLKEGGVFEVVTDFAPYRDQILKEVKPLGFETQLEIRGSEWNTKYERKWTEQGQQEFYRLVMKKSQHHSAPAGWVETELNKRKSEHFNIENYQPQSCLETPVVEFKRHLYDPGAQTLMQEVIAVEPSLSQHFWLEVRHQRGFWWTQVSPGCSIVPVVAVQKAIDLTHQAVVRSAQ